MRLTSTQRRAALAVTAFAMALTTTGCLGSTDEGGGGSAGGDDDGVVDILATTDPLVFDGLKAKIEEEAEAAGIEVNVERVDNINQLILTRIQANDPPDIAVIPQPGVIKQIVDRGKAIELTDDIVPADAISDMTPGTLEAGQIDGTQYGLMISMNVKSLVFYNKPAWDEAGFKAPESLDELARADRPDEERRRDPVVLRHRVRHRDRLAGDRLVRGPDHALRRSRGATTSGSPTR